MKENVKANFFVCFFSFETNFSGRIEYFTFNVAFVAFF